MDSILSFFPRGRFSWAVAEEDEDELSALGRDGPCPREKVLCRCDRHQIVGQDSSVYVSIVRCEMRIVEDLKKCMKF